MLGNDVSVWPGTVIQGDVNHVRIEARTNVQDGTIIHVSHESPYNKSSCPTLIGKGVSVGHRCIWLDRRDMDAEQPLICPPRHAS